MSNDIVNWGNSPTENLWEEIQRVRELSGVPAPVSSRMGFQVRDAFWCHPETLSQLPETFVCLLKKNGILVETNRWIPCSKIVLVGDIAERIGELIQFDKDIKAAMKESKAFLELLQCNGLL